MHQACDLVLSSSQDRKPAQLHGRDIVAPANSSAEACSCDPWRSVFICRKLIHSVHKCCRDLIMMRNQKLLPVLTISRIMMSAVRVPTRCRRRITLRSTQTTSVQVDTTPACRSTRRMTATNLVPDIPRRRRAVDAGPSARLRSQSGRQLMPRQN